MVEETSSIEYANPSDKDASLILAFGILPPSKNTSSLLGSQETVVVGNVSSILQVVNSAPTVQIQGLVDYLENSIKPKTNNKEKLIIPHHVSMNAEEESFFSVDQNGMTRCWDEFDRLERYTFRIKGTQITCVKFLWNMNCLAVGHRNGQLSFWHLDAGTRLSSCKPFEAISCLEVARAKNSDVLVATDFSGSICLVNLNLFKINPLQISIDVTIQGYHEPDDPVILCMVYHPTSGVLLSGGEDRTIRFWHLPKDVECQSLTAHDGPVSCLACTEHTVVSGDEEGTVSIKIITKNTYLIYLFMTFFIY